jgi:hypothetical protein
MTAAVGKAGVFVVLRVRLGVKERVVIRIEIVSKVEIGLPRRLTPTM